MMKKYLFVLMALLFAGFAYADEMEQTPTPEIYCEFVDNGCYLYVYGEGELTVIINGEVVPNFESPYFLEAKIAEDQYFDIMATACLEGYLESEPAYFSVYLHGIMIPTPMPTFSVTVTDENVVVTVDGEGDILIDYTFYYEAPIVFPREEYDYEVSIIAVAQLPDYLPSDEATIVVNVPALLRAETPEATYVVEDDCLTVTYTNPEPNGVLYYRYCGYEYSSGNEIGYTEWMVYTDPIVLTQPGYYFFESYVEAPGKSTSWTYCIQVELPEPFIPYEKTEAPTFTLTDESMSQWHYVALVTIAPSEEEEECDIYCRIRADLDGQPQGEWSDWFLYTTGPLGFIDDGHYYIEAYAIAPGKLASDTVMFDFGFSQPETPWDFMEDDMFYKIIDTDKVSVTRPSDPFIFYRNDVVIPNTVTHKGVTYMVTSIEPDAFVNCSQMVSVEIGDNVTSIDDGLFTDCPYLTKVTIGSAVKTIGSQAFDGCTEIDTIICKAVVPPVMEDSSCFSAETYNNAQLLVPRASKATYAAADYWYKFAHIDGWGSAGSGDLNGDGRLDVDDIMAIIDLLINGLPAPIEADCNNDGHVDIDDVAAIIDMVLNGTWN